MNGNPAPATAAAPPRTEKRRHRVLRRVLTSAVLVVMILGIVGQLFRDRTAWLTWLFYLPLVPIGLWAVLQDLVFAGRSLPRLRFGLTAIGLIVAAGAAWPMIATGSGAVRSADGEGGPPWPWDAVKRSNVSLKSIRFLVRPLHWNVHWGGPTRTRSAATWDSLAADIVARNPDIVVLSEAPERHNGWVAGLARDQGWDWVQCDHEPGSRYWYRLAVCCRWPVRIERHERVTNGYLMRVAIDLPGRPLRLLLVDGESNPRLSRRALLADVLAACRAGDQAGEPIDLLAGDFNTPSRSIGFDPFPDAGYRLASRAAVGWRGTFPTLCPLLDIDHVWVRRPLSVRECELFTNLETDHRGQVVAFDLPPTAARSTDE